MRVAVAEQGRRPLRLRRQALLGRIEPDGSPLDDGDYPPEEGPDKKRPKTRETQTYITAVGKPMRIERVLSRNMKDVDGGDDRSGAMAEVKSLTGAVERAIIYDQSPSSSTEAAAGEGMRNTTSGSRQKAGRQEQLQKPGPGRRRAMTDRAGGRSCLDSPLSHKSHDTGENDGLCCSLCTLVP